MKLADVDRLPEGTNTFLTVTDPARNEIIAIALSKPEGAFRIRCDIQAKKTDIHFEWDDRFGAEDYIIDMNHPQAQIVMDATSIAYILDEYTLDCVNHTFTLKKNSQGPLRHQSAI